MSEQEFEIEILLSLSKRRWSIPVIAQLARFEGAKFVTLCKTLEVNQGAMRMTLDSLILEGWVKRNEGYGHPMRPEYLLTEAGLKVSPFCLRVMELFPPDHNFEAPFQKWGMVVLYLLSKGSTRFSELRKILVRVTDRALSIQLQNLVNEGHVVRSVIDARPPVSKYEVGTVSGGLSTAFQSL